MLMFPISMLGFRVSGYLQINEQMLMSICSGEQMEEIRRNAVRLTPSEIYQPQMDLPDDNSETDSSEDMDVFKANADGEIRLEELSNGVSSLGVIPPQETADTNLNLAIGNENQRQFFPLARFDVLAYFDNFIVGWVIFMLAVTAGSSGGLVGAADKGKGIMIDADIVGGQFFGSHMGSGSGNANANGANVQEEHNDAEDCEEQG